MAKISARGRWELIRLERGDRAVILFCSDGTVLYRRPGTSRYVVLEKTTRGLRGPDKRAWDKLSPIQQQERAREVAQSYISYAGYTERQRHVTRNSYEQRQGEYWANYSRRQKAREEAQLQQWLDTHDGNGRD